MVGTARLRMDRRHARFQARWRLPLRHACSQRQRNVGEVRLSRTRRAGPDCFCQFFLRSRGQDRARPVCRGFSTGNPQRADPHRAPWHHDAHPSRLTAQRDRSGEEPLRGDEAIDECGLQRHVQSPRTIPGAGLTPARFKNKWWRSQWQNAKRSTAALRANVGSIRPRLARARYHRDYRQTRSRHPRRQADIAASHSCRTYQPNRGGEIMITVTAYKWVPPFAQGLVRDFRARWALEEIGLPYRVNLIAHPERLSPDHVAKQPFAQIPVYDEDGLTLFESGAIVLHIAEKSELLLPKDPTARAHAIQWVFAAINSVEQYVQGHVLL